MAALIQARIGFFVALVTTLMATLPSAKARIGLSVALFTTLMATLASAKDTYNLGFLSPLPNPSAEYLIPTQLAQQWQSAFRVAVEVLNGEDRPYQFVTVTADTQCDWMKVLTLSETMKKDVIGVVGPACSGAAISAAQYFDQDIALVSFAATHELLSSRNSYPNFFRTVYGDKHQTLAVLTTMEKLDITNATILCTKDYYSLSLASSIQQIAIDRISSMIVLEGGQSSSVDANQVVEVLSGLKPSDFIILVVPPLVAADFWEIAAKEGKTEYPWWYFGTDGVTAFDPYTDGSSLDLVDALQGEIGLAPFGGGDYIMNPQCQKFFDYWKEKAYPGLPLMGGNMSRSYVTHLLDTVTLYFEIADSLVKANVPVNSSSVLSALKGSGIGTPSFTGCTGPVAIDPQTGSRKISADQPATYDLVSLVDQSWQLKGRISNTTFVSMQPITRPRSESNSQIASSKSNAGMIAGLVLFSVALAVLIGILVAYYKRRKNKALSFVRM